VRFVQLYFRKAPVLAETGTLGFVCLPVDSPPIDERVIELRQACALVGHPGLQLVPRVLPCC
jgi:hypothetical protein